MVAVLAVLVGTLVGLMVHTGLDHEHEKAAYARLQCDSVLVQPPHLGVPPTALERRCGQLQDQVGWGDDSVGDFTLLVLLAPLVVGAALGAPLVAEELRRKTHRMLWTQSVTRTRWLLAQMTVAAVAVLALLGGLDAGTAFFVHVYRGEPTDLLSGGLTPRLASIPFGMTGAVPLAYGLFALGLGTALGALVRTTLGASVASAVVYPLARWGGTVAHLHVLPAAAVTGSSGWLPPGALSLASGWVPVGRLSPAPGQAWWSLGPPSACYLRGTVPTRPAAYARAVDRCAAAHGVHFVTRYLPDNRFWPLQGLEAAAFVLVGVGLVAVTAWLIGRLSA